jgi:hypothetical protein
MLTALAAKLLEFQPLGRRLPVLRCRIVPVFALTTLQRHNLSWHYNNSFHCDLDGQTPVFTASLLLDDFTDRAGADRVATFTNGEA